MGNIKLNKNSRKFLFIIGLPRSGTSLTEQILSSHENVFGGGELPYMEKIFNNYINKLLQNRFNSLVFPFKL